MGIEPINRNQVFNTNAVSFYNSRHAEGTVAVKPAGSPEIDTSIISNHPRFKTFVDEAVEKLREAGDLFKRRLDFCVDEKTNRIVVKVIDTETDKVIKEIPPEQLIKLAAKIQKMIGLLVDEKR
ncbi:MAG: flagellar protein FlaG [Spirochaetota bacterium]